MVPLLNMLREYLIDEFSLDESDVQDMLQEYVTHSIKLLAKANDAFESSSWFTLKETAHSVRGASGSIGARQIAVVAAQLEVAAGNQNAPACVAALNDMTALVSTLKKEFEQVK